MTDLFRTAGPQVPSLPALSTGDAAALSSVLWRERELLETLLFRLVSQQHLLASGAVRWLSRLDAEVEQAAQAVQDHEVVRATEVEFVVARLGVAAGAEVTLTALAQAAEEPWSDLLTEHLTVLRSLMAEIDAASTENQRLLKAGEQATREAIERSIGAPTSRGDADYGRGLGYRNSHGFGAHMLDAQA